MNEGRQYHQTRSRRQSLFRVLRAVFMTAASLIVATRFARATLNNQTPANPPQQQTVAERLGYSRETKLLMVHADDLGMARSVNAASTKAFETGLVNSGSIMVPCPWFPEIAQYARGNPQADLGLHLTLTSEWKFYRWGPVTAPDKIPGLIDPQGYLYPTAEEAASHAAAREIEIELRAQIDRARAFGIAPTHLDSHMGTLYTNPTTLATFLKVAREYKLPVMFAREWLARPDFPSSIINQNEILIDHLIQATPVIAPEKWEDYYTGVIKNLEPGVTELIVHLAYDDEEMRAATVDHKDWGAGWRQRDFDFFTGAKFRQLLKESGAKLITYRELGKLSKGQG
jgi:predicted glycoside hydrolase/deacetylase ChbG (UPF0249 family)